MIVSKLELKSTAFKPYVLQIEITSQKQQDLIQSLMATNVRVPDLLIKTSVIRAKDCKELQEIMQCVVDGINTEL